MSIFMNEWEIEDAQDRWEDHPVLGPATETLSNLRDLSNASGDGWPYWQKPLRAGQKLMELIHGDGTWEFKFGERTDATPQRLKAAYSPIKAFCTREGKTMTFVEARD